MYALDVSHWSAEISDAEVRCWWDQGVRHVIAGTQNPRITRQQLARRAPEARQTLERQRAKASRPKPRDRHSLAGGSAAIT